MDKRGRCGPHPVCGVTYAFAKKMTDEENKEEKKEKKVYYGLLSSYPPYIVRRSHFTKRFLKTTQTPSEKPLHQRSRSHFEWSRNPPKQALRTCGEL
jgi:hypothetical protein